MGVYEVQEDHPGEGSPKAGGGLCGNCGSYSSSLRDLVWRRSGKEKEVDFEGSRTPVHIVRVHVCGSGSSAVGWRAMGLL
jgi:hypothetical protein